MDVFLESLSIPPSVLTVFVCIILLIFFSTAYTVNHTSLYSVALSQIRVSCRKHPLKWRFVFWYLTVWSRQWHPTPVLLPGKSHGRRNLVVCSSWGHYESMGSLRVGHDSVTSLSLFTFMHWRRKWHPTPVLLPGESQGQRSLVGGHL